MKSVCNKWGHRDVGASNVQSKEGESEERLVDPADHDAGILLPVLDVAVMGQSRSHVPCQQTPAHSPDQSQKAVNGDVEIRFEADTAVQDYGESKSSDGEEGRCHELHEMYSQQGGLIVVFFCGPVLPK
jgi:hypothetical protein